MSIEDYAARRAEQLFPLVGENLNRLRRDNIARGIVDTLGQFDREAVWEAGAFAMADADTGDGEQTWDDMLRIGVTAMIEKIMEEEEMNNPPVWMQGGTATPSPSVGPTHTKDVVNIQSLRNLDERRLDVYRTRPGEGLQGMADVMTSDDIELIHRAIQSLDDFGKATVLLAQELEREYAMGLRCGVCGLTPNQAKEIGYDCAREC